MNFYELTNANGKSLLINFDLVTKITDDNERGKDGLTTIFYGKSYTYVKETLEEITELVKRN